MINFPPQKYPIVSLGELMLHTHWFEIVCRSNITFNGTGIWNIVGVTNGEPDLSYRIYLPQGKEFEFDVSDSEDIEEYCMVFIRDLDDSKLKLLVLPSDFADTIFSSIINKFCHDAFETLSFGLAVDGAYEGVVSFGIQAHDREHIEFFELDESLGRSYVKKNFKSLSKKSIAEKIMLSDTQLEFCQKTDKITVS